MRIVLDTNILVSALISRQGPPGLIVAAIMTPKHSLVISEFQLDEIKDVVSRNKLRSYIQPDEISKLLSNIETYGHLVKALPEINLSPDPKDNPILASAIAGKAELIISGDKSDMLALKVVEGIPIINAREALDRLRI